MLHPIRDIWAEARIRHDGVSLTLMYQNATHAGKKDNVRESSRSI